MQIKERKSVSITRTKSGVPKVQGDNELDLFYGMGYCHAMDRGIQMMLMKTLGKGQACLHLQDTEEMLVIDKFFLQYNFQGNTQSEIDKFSDTELAKLNAYCEGVNQRFKEKRPWELTVLVGFKSFSWSISDIIMMSRMAGFLTLAQSQGEVEHLFIELAQGGVPKELLQELFPNVLGDYDEDLIKRIKLPHQIIPKEVKWNNLLNPLMASNNWVVNGEKSASGKPILANDPHLEINRLPAVWYEIILEADNYYAAGATMPGISSILIGRNKEVSWGATYTFMDAIDCWMEDLKDGQYLKDEVRHDFNIRKETIKRKKESDVEISFYENEHGVLLTSPDEDGIHLTVKWSSINGGALSIQQGLSLNSVSTVEAGMEKLGKLELSFNWVLADVHGNIGYQMSGLLPKRHSDYSGFTPIPGWKSEYDWQGFHEPMDLPRSINPDTGVIVTANEDLSHMGKVNPHTITMGTYRSDRIKSLLRQEGKVSAADMKKMHMDLFSVQAELFMQLIKPLLPDNEKGNTLQNWDLCYDSNSKGAALFESIYSCLLHEVFGNVIGNEVLNFIETETGYITDFYANFDRILLSENSIWFKDRTQQEIFRTAIEQGLRANESTWGERNFITMENILVGGKFPKFIGFDKGPIPLPGNRATIHQGQVYKSNGRTTSFAPSYRMIADMNEDFIETALAGGVSDRRLSKFYKSDLDIWIYGNYKKLKS